jgi:hypothetical protein
MAQLRLSRYEAEEGMLPPLCVRCGNPATRYQGVGVSSLPVWAYLLLMVTCWPLGLAAAILPQRVRLLLPVCETHRRHWLWRRAALAACLVVMALYLNLLLSAANSAPRDQVFVLQFLFWLVGFWFLFWLIGPMLAAVVLLTRIKMTWASEISEEAVRLAGVHQNVVHAYRAEHAQGGRVPAPSVPAIQ